MSGSTRNFQIFLNIYHSHTHKILKPAINNEWNWTWNGCISKLCMFSGENHINWRENKIYFKEHSRYTVSLYFSVKYYNHENNIPSLLIGNNCVFTVNNKNVHNTTEFKIKGSHLISLKIWINLRKFKSRIHFY